MHSPQIDSIKKNFINKANENTFWTEFSMTLNKKAVKWSDLWEKRKNSFHIDWGYNFS